MRLSSHHQNLTDGIGKCSVPMWMGGCPAGFCDKDAYGTETPAARDRHMRPNTYLYVPALACPRHGGPKEVRKDGS